MIIYIPQKYNTNISKQCFLLLKVKVDIVQYISWLSWQRFKCIINRKINPNAATHPNDTYNPRSKQRQSSMGQDLRSSLVASFNLQIAYKTLSVFYGRLSRRFFIVSFILFSAFVPESMMKPFQDFSDAD